MRAAQAIVFTSWYSVREQPCRRPLEVRTRECERIIAYRSTLPLQMGPYTSCNSSLRVNTKLSQSTKIIHLLWNCPNSLRTYDSLIWSLHPLHSWNVRKLIEPVTYLDICIRSGTLRKLDNLLHLSTVVPTCLLGLGHFVNFSTCKFVASRACASSRNYFLRVIRVTTMEAKIPGKSILLFSKMITCLSKIGEDLFLEATDSKVFFLGIPAWLLCCIHC